jgi:hypothetical protein
MTSAAGAVLTIVAAAMTTSAIFVVILGPVATGAAMGGEMAWKTVSWPPGMQCWCRAPSGQPEAGYYPCEAPLGVDHPEL